MRTDVLLEIMDHLFPVLKILDSEKDGHRDCEETDQSKDDLKSETFIEPDLSHENGSSSGPLL
jgi:hypothetical protein